MSKRLNQALLGDNGNLIVNCRTWADELEMLDTSANQLWLAHMACVDAIEDGLDVTIIVVASPSK